MKNLRRTLAVLLTLAALAAVVVGVTYAWRDSRQHKSNEMGGGTGPRYEGRLVEEFDEVTDWKVSDGPVTKKIRVSNLGKSSDSFGDIYVRIQLKEYMEIGQASFKETEKRYMINETDGKFLVYGSEELARAAHPGHEVAQLYDAVVGVGGWFIETRAHDSNGQMGKYVITEITIGSATPVIGGSTRAVNLNHHGHPSDECNYPVHAWNGTTLATTQYVEWHLNDAKIMKLSDWLAAGSPEVDMWIIDDMSNSGWVYWGRVLHTDGDITADFMRSVSLKEQPEGSFYYVIHVELEAVSHDELSNWGNVGDGLGQHRPGPTNPPQETPAPTPDPGATPTPVPTSSPPPPPGTPDLPLQKGEQGPYAPSVGGSADTNFACWIVGRRDKFDQVIVDQKGSIKLKDIFTSAITDYSDVTVTPNDPSMAGNFEIGQDKANDWGILYSYYPGLAAWDAAIPNWPVVTTTVTISKPGYAPATITVTLRYDSSYLG